MSDYEVNFQLNKNKLNFEGEICKNKLEANLLIKSGDKYFEYEQATPADVWVIKHNLNKKPSIMVVDSADTVHQCERKYLDMNTVRLKFNGCFSGKAYFS